MAGEAILSRPGTFQAANIRATLARAGTGRRRLLAMMREEPARPGEPPPLTDEEWFEAPANHGRSYRVREWRRADWPDPDSRYGPLVEPLCTVVEYGPGGPVVVAQPADIGATPIIDTDQGARALIAAIRTLGAL